MKLLTVPSSPFGRKVLIVLHRHGLMDRTEMVPVHFMNPEDPIHIHNPLGKMPAMITDEGQSLSDSPVLLEYLDQLIGPGSVIPTEWPERLAQVQAEAIADGMMDAAAMLVLEKRMRAPDKIDMNVVEFQRRKIARAIARFEKTPPDPADVRVASISLACALGFLDRRGQYDWRAAAPGLIAWLDAFRTAAPEYDLTHVPPEEGWVSL